MVTIAGVQRTVTPNRHVTSLSPGSRNPELIVKQIHVRRGIPRLHVYSRDSEHDHPEVTVIAQVQPCQPIRSDLDPLEEIGVKIEIAELLVIHQLLMEGNRGFDPFDDVFIKRHLHPIDGILAGFSMDNQLADH